MQEPQAWLVQKGKNRISVQRGYFHPEIPIELFLFTLSATNIFGKIHSLGSWGWGARNVLNYSLEFKINEHTKIRKEILLSVPKANGVSVKK